ncbi:MAG: sulfide-dependent adenosine diphosphate thiazole synthase [Spirochaetes bacterium]|nr:sulfide-dependent adenosine diphosphate thiazole synthase [Spirochaetota bacterium]
MNKDIQITRFIVDSFFKKFSSAIELDVAIAGCGPSALACSYILAKNGINVGIFEAKNEPGGGIWGGGMFFNEIIVENDIKNFLEENRINYTENGEFLIIDAVHFAGALIYNSTKAGAKIFNNINVEDILFDNVERKVCGFVINFNSVSKLKLHIDPISIKANYCIDATGHPAHIVNYLVDRGMIDLKIKEYPMNAENGEKMVVENSKEIYPGLFVMGMAATSSSNSFRMGPIFGGMIKSGIKTANEILMRLKK